VLDKRLIQGRCVDMTCKLRGTTTAVDAGTIRGMLLELLCELVTVLQSDRAKDMAIQCLTHCAASTRFPIVPIEAWCRCCGAPAVCFARQWRRHAVVLLSAADSERVGSASSCGEQVRGVCVRHSCRYE
jgi:hypothetical protein